MSTSVMESFSVEGLYGRTNIDAQIDDNTLILVGENGSGKTTFLRIMFNFLSGRWPALAQFKFKQVSARINGQTYSLSYDLVRSAVGTYDRSFLSALPPSARNRIAVAERAGRWEEVDQVFRRYFGPSYSGYQASPQAYESKRLLSLGQQISEALNSQILYLPTYRRIERELSSILRGIDDDEARKAKIVKQEEADPSYIELVEFGMNDVQKAIDEALEKIRNFANTGLNTLTLSYLGDVVSQTYVSTAKQEIAEASDATISSVLNRIRSGILSEANKDHLRSVLLSAKSGTQDPSEHEKIIYHYFSKLMNFQSQLQEREANIKSFCDLCSSYISSKKFIYDDQTFRFHIMSDWSDVDSDFDAAKVSGDEGTPPGSIRLSDLSSGEKQIVSLFSHLYLSGVDRYFVLIDEPELSLSVPWQRRFLTDIRGGGFCSGLVAVTHSPFIYDNELRRHARALGEFMNEEDWGRL